MACVMMGLSNEEGSDMEDKKDLQELLERLDQSNRQQAKYAR